MTPPPPAPTTPPSAPSWRALLVRAARGALSALTRTSAGATTGTTTQPKKTVPTPGSPHLNPQQKSRGATPGRYPGDFTGTVTAEYSPDLDGEPDPGEIVWTWVPYEEDFSRGKDRPVLLVGRDGGWLLGLMLTSKDHSRDAADEARYGRRWLDIGSGPWDPQGRDSEVRLDRVVRVDPSGVRREGAVLSRSTFDVVVKGIGRGR